MTKVLRTTTTLQRFILFFTLGSMLTACAATEGFPDRAVDVKTQLGELQARHSTAKITAYNKATDAEKPALRNDFVYARMAAIDLHFGNFQQALFREGVRTGIATDWTVLGLGGAGALVSGGTSQILSAISGGVIGAKGAFDKRAYFNNTITTLLTAMVANRKTVEVKIRQGLAQSVTDYPLSAALVHLTEYYEAGTIPGALTGIALDSGAKAQEADDDIARIRETKFRLITDTGAKIKAWALLSNENKTALNDWRNKNLPGVPFPLFFRFVEFEAKRVELINELSIP